ncbi:MAG: hypothetical protein ACRENP_19555 [Longimicrobiales bacterium]
MRSILMFPGLLVLLSGAAAAQTTDAEIYLAPLRGAQNDLAAQRAIQVTRTPESEYSPTPTAMEASR